MVKESIHGRNHRLLPTPGGSGVTYLPKIKNQPCTALIKANPSTGNVTFNAATDFVAFPGGEKKFVVEYDSVSQKYYALSNPVLNADIGLDTSGDTRNTAAIMSSTDLRHWTVNSLFLYGARFKYSSLSVFELRSRWQQPGRGFANSLRRWFGRCAQQFRQ